MIRKALPEDAEAVARIVAGPNGKPMEVVQFEQLIGQVTEHLEAHYFEVDRERRFLPIKTREQLEARRRSAGERNSAASPSPRKSRCWPWKPTETPCAST